MTTTETITLHETKRPAAKRVGRPKNTNIKSVQPLTQPVCRPPGRPKRESPLTPEEIKERKKNTKTILMSYKGNANGFISIAIIKDQK